MQTPQPSIETSRLEIKPFELADAPYVQKLAGNPNVSKTTLNMPYPYEDGIAEQWIASHSKHWQARTSAAFAIKLKANGQLIGNISLVAINGDQAELGYWLGEPFWNQGYGSEAATALVQMAGTAMGIRTVIAEHLQSNPASGRLMQKIGMSYSHTLERRDRDGQLAKVDVYQLRL